MNTFVAAVVERQARFNEAVRKGAPANWAGLVRDRYAWAVSKDTLGYAHFDAVEPASVNEAEHSATAIITTLDEDRDGDVVVPLGCQYGNFARNPTWFWGHQSWEVPIGKGKTEAGLVCVWPEENLVRAKCFFDKDDPDSDFIFGKVRRGFVNAVSVAFVPLQAFRRERNKAHRDAHHSQSPQGWHFDLWDLTEVSWVGVPANAGALRDALDHEKSFITPKLHKAMLPYAACASGECFNGWCPPCDEEAPMATKKGCCPACKAGKPCCTHTKVAKEQPSEDISPDKACQILRDGEANGKPLTEAQRGMFGAACGKKKWLRMTVVKGQHTFKVLDKPPARRKDLSGLNENSGAAGGYVTPGDVSVAGGNSAATGEGSPTPGGPVKCPKCEFETADASMRFCPHCGMGLVPLGDTKHLEEDDLVTKDDMPPGGDREPGDEEEGPEMKSKSAHKVVTKAEGEGAEDLADQPKHSALVLAHLHNHARNGLDYIDRETSRMDHNDIADALTKHKDDYAGHQEMYKDLMEEHHPDHDIEELSKSISSGGGEATAVGEGDVPEDAEDEDSGLEEVEDETPEVEGTVEDNTVERGMAGGDGDEDVSETPTEELLERYRQPKSLHRQKTKAGVNYVVKFKDGARRVCKDKTEADKIMKGVVGVVKSAGPGSLHRGHFEVVRDAGQHLYDLATKAEDLPSYHRAGLMHHSNQLGELCKELEGLEEDEEAGGGLEEVEGEDVSPGPDLDDAVTGGGGEETPEEEYPEDEETKALLRTLSKRLDGTAQLIFQQTGTRLN